MGFKFLDIHVFVFLLNSFVAVRVRYTTFFFFGIRRCDLGCRIATGGSDGSTALTEALALSCLFSGSPRAIETGLNNRVGRMIGLKVSG